MSELLTRVGKLLILIVAECNVNLPGGFFILQNKAILIVAECNVNRNRFFQQKFHIIILIVAECNVNVILCII